MRQALTRCSPKHSGSKPQDTSPPGVWLLGFGGGAVAGCGCVPVGSCGTQYSGGLTGGPGKSSRSEPSHGARVPAALLKLI